MNTVLVLASGSPRRKELLESIGLEFVVQPSDVDESVQEDEEPLAYVERVARSKAIAVVSRMGIGATGSVVVLAADTTVVIDGEILGKPIDDDDARRMLKLLSGATHQVHTCVVGWRITGTEAVTVTTDVTFSPLTDRCIDWYIGLGEYGDKAGGYGIQSAGGALVNHIEGSPTNVIGLPMIETIRVLGDCGVRVAGG